MLPLHAEPAADAAIDGLLRALGRPAARVVRPRRPLLGLAGVAAIVAAALLFAELGAPEIRVLDGRAAVADRMVRTTANDVARIELADRNQVRLLESTRLNVREDGVRMHSGEAVFKITRRPADRPWEVRTPQARIAVIGTQFQVSCRAQATRVTVLSGRVEIAGAAGAQPARPGDVVEVAQDGVPRVVSSPDHLPPGAVARIGGPAPFLHQGSVPGADFSPDGSTILTTCHDGGVRFWDASTGRLARLVPASKRPAFAAAFSPDGRLCVTTHMDRIVRLWDADTGRPAGELKGHGRHAIAAVFSPDGTRIATGGLDGTVRIFDREGGERLSIPVESPSRLAFSADGDRLAVLDSNGAVTTWNSSTGAAGPRCGTGSGRAFLSTDGSRVGFVTDDGLLRILEVATGKELLNAPAGQAPTVAVGAMSPDGRRVALAMNAIRGTRITVHDAGTGAELRRFGADDELLIGLRFSRDGARLLALGTGRAVRVFDVESGARVPAPRGHAGAVAAVALSPDGRKIVSAGADGTLRWWSLDGRLLHEDRVNPDRPMLAWSPDGRRVVVADPERLRVFAADDRRVLLDRRVDSIWPARISPNGKLVALAIGAGVEVFDVDKQAAVALYPRPLMEAVGFLDGETALLSTGGFTPEFVVARNGTTRPGLKLTPRMGESVHAGDGGLILQTGLRGSDVILEEGGRRTTARLTDALVSPIVVCPGGDLLAAEVRGAIRVWERFTLKPMATFDLGQEGGLQSLAISNDGRRLVSGHETGSVVVWDLLSTTPGADPLKILLETDAAAVPAAWAAILAEGDLRMAKSAVEDRLGTPKPDPALTGTIRALDADALEERDRAEAALRGQGPSAEPSLRAALGSAGTEGAARIRRLLDGLNHPVVQVPEVRRILRIIRALEMSRAPEARALLGELKDGAPSARERAAAAGALVRLEAR